MSTGLAALASNPATKKAALDFASKHVVPLLKEAFGRKIDEARTLRAAEAYTTKVTQNVAFCKTFLHHDRPIHIQRFYQPMVFGYNLRGDVIDTVDSITRLGSCVAIVGHAGSGKSTALKHLAWQCISESDRVPVFIELRRLVTRSSDGKRMSLSIRDAISQSILQADFSNVQKAFDTILDSNRVVVFLDGFDELPNTWKVSYSNELLSLIEQYPRTRWVVSTRPEDLVTRLSKVYVVTPRELTLEDACKHVDRYDVDQEHQESFKELLRSRLYREHPRFASNPLLLAVLFITYRSHHRVSDRPHLFFEEVYEALCSRHDERKGGFERELACGLPKDKFNEVVHLFCWVTAVRERLIFQRSEIDGEIKEVLEGMRLDVQSGKVREDLVRSISLMVEDGNEYVFLYKSLQEFLAAKYVASIRDDVEIKKESLAAVSRNPLSSMSLFLLHGIEQDWVEEILIRPLLRLSIDRLREDRLGDPEGFLRYSLEAIRKGLERQPVVPLPAPWNSQLQITGVVKLVERLYPDQCFTRPSSSRTWWLNKDGEFPKSDKLFVSKGLEYYRDQKNLGDAERRMGFSLALESELNAFLDHLNSVSLRRTEAKNSEEALITRVLLSKSNRMTA